MLLVETYLDNSSINGLGIFSTHKIKKGEIIWKFYEGLDIKIHKDDLHKLNLNPAQLKFIDTYFWRQGEYFYSCCDHSTFQNHSSNENSVQIGDYLYASRDIEVGEEITIDYSSFDDDFILYKDTLIN